MGRDRAARSRDAAHASEIARALSADAELRLADLMTLFDVPRQLH